MTNVEDELRALGVTGILLTAAALGRIPELACKVHDCLCPQELGGTGYFEPRPPELSDWMPTDDHFPKSKAQGGWKTVENTRLAHRLCNRVDAARSAQRSYERDKRRAEAARRAAIDGTWRRPGAFPASVRRMLLGPDHMVLREFVAELHGWDAIRLETLQDRGHGPTGIRILRGRRRFTNVYPAKSLQFAHGGAPLPGLPSAEDAGPSYQSIPTKELGGRLDEARLLAAYAYWRAGTNS
jgi:hypothetical protein